MADPQYIYRQLQSQGFSPEEAAAITGNVIHESNLDTSALNRPEGAYGLMQWRGDRRIGLEDYAREQGVPVSDLDAQIGYMGTESRGPEAAAYARAFGRWYAGRAVDAFQAVRGAGSAGHR